jgi:uncharacterized protein YifE (UPF0438 family)
MKKLIYILSFAGPLIGLGKKLSAQSNYTLDDLGIQKPTNLKEWKEVKTVLKEEFTELNDEMCVFMERVFSNYSPKDPEKKRFNVLTSMVNRHIVYSEDYKELDSLYKEYVFKKPNKNGEFKIDKNGQPKESFIEKTFYSLNAYRFGKIGFNVDNEFIKYNGTKKTPVPKDSIIYRAAAQKYMYRK